MDVESDWGFASRLHRFSDRSYFAHYGSGHDLLLVSGRAFANPVAFVWCGSPACQRAKYQSAHGESGYWYRSWQHVGRAALRAESGAGFGAGGRVGMGIGALVFSHFVHTLPFAALWLIVIGGMGGLFIVPLNAILQHRPKPDEKGRVIATAKS